jgi:hypothetical protein
MRYLDIAEAYARIGYRAPTAGARFQTARRVQ